MQEIKLRQFQLEDYYAIISQELVTKFAILPDSTYILRLNQLRAWSMPCYTVTMDNAPIASGGLDIPDEEGEPYFWFICTKKFSQFPLTLCRMASTVIDELMAVYDTDVFATCAHEFERGERFLRFLGFQRLRDTKDYLIYRRRKWAS